MFPKSRIFLFSFFSELCCILALTLLLLHILSEIERQSGYSPRAFQLTPLQILDNIGITENIKNASNSGKQAKQLSDPISPLYIYIYIYIYIYMTFHVLTHSDCVCSVSQDSFFCWRGEETVPNNYYLEVTNAFKIKLFFLSLPFLLPNVQRNG